MRLLLYSNSAWGKDGPSYGSHPAPILPSQRREVSQCLGLGKRWEREPETGCERRKEER